MPFALFRAKIAPVKATTQAQIAKMVSRSDRAGAESDRKKNLDFGLIARDFLRETDPGRPDKGRRYRTLCELLIANDPKTLLHYACGKPKDVVSLEGASQLAGLMITVTEDELPQAKNS